jgi:hypothetical protein
MDVAAAMTTLLGEMFAIYLGSLAAIVSAPTRCAGGHHSGVETQRRSDASRGSNGAYEQNQFNRAGPRPGNIREVAMTCNAELVRRYHTRDEASRYLASRGFLFLPNGWANGRWVANLERENNEYTVTVRLPAHGAA